MKNREIKARVDSKTEKNFLDKCKELGITKTQLIEKIANEPIIFLDKNAKNILKEIKD